jgi:biuret amidohydrolase
MTRQQGEEQAFAAGDRKTLSGYRQAMNDFTLSPSSSALLIVDLQVASADLGCGWLPVYRAHGYVEEVDAYLARMRGIVLPNVRRLQQVFRQASAPVIFLTVGSVVGDLADMPPRFTRAARYWSKLGITPPYAKLGSREILVLEEIAPQPGEAVITKTGASGFTASPLERVLWNRNVRELAICGVATHYCVESTLRDASDRGFDCVAVQDACAAFPAELHELGLRSMAPFCRIETTDEVVAELGAGRS